MLLEHRHVWSEGRRATDDELLLVHARDHVERVRGVDEPTWLDGDTIATETTFEAAALAAGTAVEAALRGDPSDKLPGARGIGPKKAADILREHGTLEAVLAAGRFAAEAEDLRLYRRIAGMDASAPLPPLADQSPTWAEASTFVRGLGLNGLADRLASLA